MDHQDQPESVNRKPGWWVPAEQYLQQALLPRSGAWQIVRQPSGAVVTAVILHGQSGWHDGNYNRLRPQPTDWFKPQRWFQGPDDLVGDRAALEAARTEARKGGASGILRHIDDEPSPASEQARHRT